MNNDISKIIDELRKHKTDVLKRFEKNGSGWPKGSIQDILFQRGLNDGIQSAINHLIRINN